MKTEFILGIISGICLVLGCIFYLIRNRISENEKLSKSAGVLCVIFTAISIGLIIGISNIPHTEDDSNNIETEEVIYDKEIDP